MSEKPADGPCTIKAFPTWYRGRSYRSRLEADFARLLDVLQIRFEYEPQSFLLDDGTHYLPDFWCPDLDLWVETRGYRSEKGSRQINGFAKALQALSRDRPVEYMVLSVDWRDEMFLTGNRSERLPVVANPGVLPICDRCGQGSFVSLWWQQRRVFCRRCRRPSAAHFATSIFVSGSGHLMLGESSCEDTFTSSERLLHSEPVVGRSWRAAEWIESHEAGWSQLREWNQGPSLAGLDDEWCEAEKAREIALRER